MTFIGHKVGAEYRVANFDKYEFVYLNYFNKLILDGSVDLGLKYTQKLSHKLSFTLLTDWVLSSDYKVDAAHAGTSQTSQLTINYKLNPHATLQKFYRVYAVPSGISSKDTSMEESVPALSDLWGLNISLSL